MFLYIAVKAKNVVTLSVNKIFAQPGIGQHSRYILAVMRIRIRIIKVRSGSVWRDPYTVNVQKHAMAKNLNYLLIWTFSYIFIIFF